MNLKELVKPSLIWGTLEFFFCKFSGAFDTLLYGIEEEEKIVMFVPRNFYPAP